MLEIFFQRRALRDMQALPAADRLAVFARLEAYTNDPTSGRHDLLMLVGSESGHRLRVGDLRVILDQLSDRIIVRRVQRRGDTDR